MSYRFSSFFPCFFFSFFFKHRQKGLKGKVAFRTDCFVFASHLLLARDRESLFATCKKNLLKKLEEAGLASRNIKSVSMRKPGRTRQEVIQLKSPISLKLGTNVGFGE